MQPTFWPRCMAALEEIQKRGIAGEDAVDEGAHGSNVGNASNVGGASPSALHGGCSEGWAMPGRETGNTPRRTAPSVKDVRRPYVGTATAPPAQALEGATGEVEPEVRLYQVVFAEIKSPVAISLVGFDPVNPRRPLDDADLEAEVECVVSYEAAWVRGGDSEVEEGQAEVPVTRTGYAAVRDIVGGSGAERRFCSPLSYRGGPRRDGCPSRLDQVTGTDSDHRHRCRSCGHRT